VLYNLLILNIYITPVYLSIIVINYILLLIKIKDPQEYLKLITIYNNFNYLLLFSESEKTFPNRLKV